MRSDSAMRLNVVTPFPADLPRKRDELSFLMTDLPGNAVELTKPHARRMSAEELLQDGKDCASRKKRGGLSLSSLLLRA